MKIHADSHVDHELSAAQLAFAIKEYIEKYVVEVYCD